MPFSKFLAGPLSELNEPCLAHGPWSKYGALLDFRPAAGPRILSRIHRFPTFSIRIILSPASSRCRNPGEIFGVWSCLRVPSCLNSLSLPFCPVTYVRRPHSRAAPRRSYRSTSPFGGGASNYANIIIIVSFLAHLSGDFFWLEGHPSIQCSPYILSGRLHYLYMCGGRGVP